MDLRRLRYFVTVADELNFTRAAERLHMAQPPLSMQIRALEEALGTALFVRSKRKVALTPAGEHLLERARRLLADTAAAADEVRRIARGEAGRLRVGFTSSMPYSAVLGDVLRRYRAQYPAVDLQLREMFTRDQFAALGRGELDVGFVRHPATMATEGVVLREIGRDPLRLVMAASHPAATGSAVRMVDLRDEGFITFPPDVGTGLPSLLQQLCRSAGFEPRIVQTAREATTQIGLAAAGLGIALLPAQLECVHIPRARYLPIADAAAVFSLSVAMAEGEVSPLLAGFLEVLDAVRASVP
ncbi:LysR substrate-binding domain-containing protein [Denitromonas iodatirespirans]|uniref:LysR family transcriptional regulator n=1 Tax=Denitromonas iodatirespirans TaxID=2795389 RepID=A0A944D6C6_DENI1|nr:LysR substrate-binding domain-containing protein [Denitromonas iodatirespirans]MBT0960810.1 LysR family transcriptional regulator [Denitromonas iodatirespirans]